MVLLEPLEAKIVVNTDGVWDGVTKARDTLKTLDPQLRKQLKINIDNAFLRVQNLRNEVKKFDDITKAPRELRIDLERAKKDLTEARRRLTNFTNTGDPALSRLQSKFNQVSGSISSLSSRVLGFWTAIGAVWAGIVALGRQVSQGVRDVIAFESAFTGVRKTVDATEIQFGLLRKELWRLSTSLGLPFEEIARVAELAGQLGVAVDDIGTFTDTVVKIAATTNITTEQAATDFARLANVLNIPLDRVEELATVTVKLGNNFATTEREILTFTQRLSSAGAAAWFAQQDLQAIATSLSSLGIQAEAWGTAVSKSFIAIQAAVSTGGDELQKFADLAWQTSEEFAQRFRDDAGEAFTSLIEGLAESGEDAVNIIDDLFWSNVRTRNAFLSLAAGSDILSDALRTANRELETQNSLQEEAEKRFQTTEARLWQLREEIRQNRAEIGENFVPALVRATEAATRFSKFLADGLEDIGKPLSEIVNEARGLGLTFEEITEEAKTSEEALGLLNDKIDDLTTQFKNWEISADEYGNEIQRVWEFVSSVQTQVVEGLVPALDNLWQQLINGTIDIDSYVQELSELQTRADEAWLTLDSTSSITRTLNGVFASLNTANSQEQLNAIKQEALGTIDSIIALADSLRLVWVATDIFASGSWPVAFDADRVAQAARLQAVSAQIKETRQDVEDFDRFFETSVAWGGSSSGGRRSRAVSDTDEAEKERQKIIKESEKEIQELQKQSEKRRSDALKDAEKEAKEVYDAIWDAVEDQQDRVDELTDKIKESVQEIGDLRSEIEQINADAQTDLASRWVDVDEDIAEARSILNDDDSTSEERNAASERILALQREKELIEANTTAEERAEAVRQAGLSAAERILEERDKEVQAIEQKIELLATETERLQEQKQLELEILENVKNKQISFEEEVTARLGIEVSRRKELYDELIEKALEAQRIARSISSTWAGSTTNNNTTNQTFNVTSPEVASNLERNFIR